MSDLSRNSSNETSEQPRPWWREPWPWILMAGPAVAVIGCIITIVLALQNFGDQEIHDGGLKRGLVVSKHPPAAHESSRH